MPEIKFSVSEEHHNAFKRSAGLLAMPVAVWARSALIALAQKDTPKPEAAPKLTAKQRNEIGRFEETLGNLQERIASNTDDLSSIGQWLARRRRDAGQTARDRAYTDAFEAWCVERGLITKGE